MARVYADVNQHMPKSYYEYDSVNITWGVLENYEVVRKIGIISRVSCRSLAKYCREGQVFRGLRRDQRRQLPEMCDQSIETCQEEEDKAGDQDIAKPFRRTQCSCASRCCERQSKQNTLAHIRVRQQHGLPKPVSQIWRL